jgi:glycerophosphoryl diester phosphodiesterase
MLNFDKQTADADRKVLIFAHRGASGMAPENTAASFKKAVDLGADGIELDVQLTSDGHIVVVHDERLGRTCNGSGMVMDLTLEYLRKLDFGGWYSEKFSGEKIPLLDEVIELTKESGTVLNIEIKAIPGKYNPGIEEKLAGIIKENGIEGRTIISSFNHFSLEKLKDMHDGINIAPLYVGMFKDICGYAAKLRADFIHPIYESVTEDVISSCKACGIGVNVWTVDMNEDIRKMAVMGVTGIIANRPDEALRILKEIK